MNGYIAILKTLGAEIKSSSSSHFDIEALISTFIDKRYFMLLLDYEKYKI